MYSTNCVSIIQEIVAVKYPLEASPTKQSKPIVYAALDKIL